MIHLEGRGKNLKGILDLLWALRKPKAKGVGSGSGEQKLWLWFKLGRGWGNSAVGWFSLFYLKPSEVSRTLAETLVLILVLFLIKKLTCCSVFTEADITVSQFSKSWNVAAGLSPNHYVLSCNITASFGDLTRTISCTSFWEEWAEVRAHTHTLYSVRAVRAEESSSVGPGKQWIATCSLQSGSLKTGRVESRGCFLWVPLWLHTVLCPLSETGISHLGGCDHIWMRCPAVDLSSLWFSVPVMWTHYGCDRCWWH